MKLTGNTNMLYFWGRSLKKTQTVASSLKCGGRPYALLADGSVHSDLSLLLYLESFFWAVTIASLHGVIKIAIAESQIYS